MLYAFPADRTGCAHYRIVWPLTALRGAVDYRIIYPGDDVPLKAEISRENDDWGTPSVKAIEIPDDCSAVMLQRPTSKLLMQCIPLLKQRGISVIVELDDDLHAVSPRHASYKALHPVPDKRLPAPLDSLDALKQACELADLVICSTPALLARYAPPGPLGGARGVVLRNRLRSDFRSCLKNGNGGGRTAPPPDSPRVSRVGWGGVITTHPDDLQVLSRVLPRLSIPFNVVGPAPREEEGGLIRASRLLGLSASAINFTGSVPFADWLPHLQSSIDIGVAPLEDNIFNRSKSWLKKLEYSACGIPHVAADTPEYRLMPTGLTASTHKDWSRQLTRLINSPALQDDLRASGYLIADANTYALHSEEWHTAISPLVSR